MVLRKRAGATPKKNCADPSEGGELWPDDVQVRRAEQDALAEHDEVGSSSVESGPAAALPLSAGFRFVSMVAGLIGYSLG